MANKTAEVFAGGFRPYYTTDYEVQWLTVSSDSGHIRAGDPVVIKSNREVNSMTLDDGASTDGQLYGVSAGEGDAGDKIPVIPGKTDTIFVGKTYKDVSSTGDTWPFTCDVGTTGSATRTSTDTTDITGEVVLLADSSTEGVVQVLGPVNPEGDDLDDTSDGVLLKFVIHRSSYNDLVSAK